MKSIIYPANIAVLITTSAFTFIINSDYKVQEDAYSVKFVSKKFEGIFKGLVASIQFDEADLANSKIIASIDANSGNSGNGMRNKHTSQALEADKFPRIKFESSSISKTGSGYEAVGKLTIKDVTKEIKLPFTFEKNDNGGVFAGKFTVLPKEYNVTKSGTPEEFEIQLNVPVTK